MKLNDDSRTRLLIDMTLDTDPTGSTVELKIDDTWYPATWQGSVVSTGKRWTQTMRTTGYFAGPLAVAGGATVLAIGRHLTETRVSWPGGDIIVSESSPIDVKTNVSTGPPATDARVAATVTALDADPTSAYRVQADARLSASYAKKPKTVSKLLGRVSLVSHRGSQNLHPSNTLDGFRAGWRLGLPIETDVKMLATGELVIAHDSDCSLWSVSTTGNVEDKTAAQWRAIRVKPVIEGGQTYPPPFLDDVFDEMIAHGGTGFFEVKSTGPNPVVAAALRDAIMARGLDRSAIVSSYNLADITPARDAGIDVAHYVSDTALPASYFTSNGVEYVGAVTSVGKTYVDTLKAAGLVVVLNTFNTQHEVNFALDQSAGGLHGDMIVSDDAIGTSKRFSPRCSDSFSTRQGWPRIQRTANGKVTFMGAKPNELGLLYTDGNYASVHLGDLGVFDIPSSGFSIRWTMRFGARSADTSFGRAGLLIGKPSYSTTSIDLLSYSNPGPGDQAAYAIHMNRDGSQEGYRINGGAAPALLASRSSGVTAVPASGERTVEMQVVFTATTIEIKNLTDGTTSGANQTNATGAVTTDTSPQRFTMQVGLYAKNTDVYFSNVFLSGLTTMPIP